MIELPYPRKAWTEAEISLLRAAYEGAQYRGDLDLDSLAKTIGRQKPNICRKARALGLTGKLHCRPVEPPARKFASTAELREAQSAAARERIRSQGHPRGMAGKSHSDETKQKLRISSLEYRSTLTEEQASDIAMKAVKTALARHGRVGPTNARGSWKAGWREVGDKRNYYRSRWEANYARYLQWLKVQGQITDWQHEPETFWFEAIRRGVRSYLPDFRVTENDQTSVLHEVKGWMDSRSKTTLARMKKYHPQERIIVICERDYNSIARKVSGLIPGWEESGRAGRW